MSAVVGYLTVDALVRLVRQVPFWAVCTVFGGLGVVGGLLVALYGPVNSECLLLEPDISTAGDR